MRCGYEYVGMVKSLAASLDDTTVSAAYDEHVVMTVAFPVELADEFKKEVGEKSSGKVVVLRGP